MSRRARRRKQSRQKISIFLVGVMLFSMLSGIFPGISVFADDDLGSSIFEFVYFKVNETLIEDGDVIDIGPGTFAEIQFDWNTQNLKSPAKREDIATIQLRVTKIDAETGEKIADNEATFKLYFKLNGVETEYTQIDEDTGEVIPFSTVEGVREIGNLPIRTYYLKEVKAPKGYVLSEEELQIDVLEPIGNGVSAIKVGTFENTKEKIDITGTKEWVNGPKPTIQLQLYRALEGEEKVSVGDLVTLDGKENPPWTYTWDNLDKTDNSGTDYVYTVDEVEVPENYGKAISEDGLTVTNTYIPPTEDVTATKVWTRGSSPRPTVWFKLYRQIGNEPRQEFGARIKELPDGTTEVTWEGLPVTDNDGNEYIYSVQEVDADGNDFVPSRYRKTENGLEVENTRRSGGGGFIPPGPVDPEEPTEPMDPTDPTGPGGPETTDPDDPTVDIEGGIPGGGIVIDPNEDLPKVGEGRKSIFYLAGLGLVSVGLYLRRKKIV